MDSGKISRHGDAEEMIMADTIYSMFEDVVAGHRNETAIIENNRVMTFGSFPIW